MFNVGFTTSIPVEIIYAAGHTPIDLNNIFVLNNPLDLVKQAELSGFPRNICSWIKGMYSVITKSPLPEYKIDVLIGVVQGDCSNTHSLMSILQDENIKILPFSYPFDRNKDKLISEIHELETFFKITRDDTEKMKQELDKIRKKLYTLDEMTWKTNQVTSLENHLWLVTSSDFNTNYHEYDKNLDDFLKIASLREPQNKDIRLGYVGVPPIIDDLYQFIDDCNARVVFNEVQRQFAMLTPENNIIDQYLSFTYPYSIFKRINDIQKEIKRRNINGLICYTQSFCHRQLDILILKKYLDIPILQIEGDQPSKLDERTKLRIESFLEMLRG